MDLAGHIIVITGASQGIGRAVAQSCMAVGATIIPSSLSGANETAKVDVRDTTAVHDWMQDIIRQHGHIDTVIHCAGVAEHPAGPDTLSPEDFSSVIDVNLAGAYRVAHEALPGIRESQAGCMLFLASRAGRSPHSRLPAYSASKAGVLGLTQSIARFFKEELPTARCISISPGGVNTQMRRDLFGPRDSAAQQSPEAVAAIIMQILTDTIDVQNGADVVVVRGAIQEIVSMP